MSQRPPSGSYIRGVWDFFFPSPTPTFTSQWDWKPIFPAPAFKIKPVSTRACFDATILKTNLFDFRDTSTHLSLAWQSPSPSLNAEFGAWKALSAADNGGSACYGRAGRCNFSWFPFLRFHRPFKVLFSRRCVKYAILRLHAHLLFFSPSTSVALERGPTAAPRLRQFWVHLQITPLTTPRVETKRRVFGCKPLTNVTRSLPLSPPVNLERCDMTMRCELVKHAPSHQPQHTSKSSSSWSTGPKALSPLLKSEWLASSTALLLAAVVNVTSSFFLLLRWTLAAFLYEIEPL